MVFSSRYIRYTATMAQTRETIAGRGAEAAPLACNHAAPDHASGLPPIHPGEVLWANFMQPMGLSVERVSGVIGIAPETLQTVIDGKQPVDTHLGWRLARYFGTELHLWSRLQQEFDQETSAGG